MAQKKRSTKPSIPSDVRETVLARSKGHCERCMTCWHRGDDKCPGWCTRLELHHLHYQTVGHESPDDLEAICRTCHNEAHRDENGDFWLTEDEKDAYWYTFYKEMDKD